VRYFASTLFRTLPRLRVNTRREGIAPALTRLALTLLAATASTASAGTISEFPHPAVVIQLHPAAKDPFALEDIDLALGDEASGIELDLRYRATDGAVVCSHEKHHLADRPTLEEAIQRILSFQGDSPTVHKDSLQFFLVLDFKGRSSELYEGAVQVLRRHKSSWSTSADSTPRGITVLASGERAGLREMIPAATLDSLLIVEGEDYRGRIQDRSPKPGRTFQWIAIQHPGERGRVRALHAGTDLSNPGVFNVRAYDCRGHIRECLATGVDAVNADRDEIARALSR
jgi:hypothetical protein